MDVEPYTDKTYKEKLSSLTDSKVALELLSRWMIHHRKHAQRMKYLWVEHFHHQALDEQHQRSLVFLLSEVLGWSKSICPPYFKVFSPLVDEVDVWVGTLYPDIAETWCTVRNVLHTKQIITVDDFAKPVNGQNEPVAEFKLESSRVRVESAVANAVQDGSSNGTCSSSQELKSTISDCVKAESAPGNGVAVKEEERASSSAASGNLVIGNNESPFSEEQADTEAKEIALPPQQPADVPEATEYSSFKEILSQEAASHQFSLSPQPSTSPSLARQRLTDIVSPKPSPSKTQLSRQRPLNMKGKLCASCDKWLKPNEVKFCKQCKRAKSLKRTDRKTLSSKVNKISQILRPVTVERPGEVGHEDQKLSDLKIVIKTSLSRDNKPKPSSRKTPRAVESPVVLDSDSPTPLPSLNTSAEQPGEMDEWSGLNEQDVLAGLVLRLQKCLLPGVPSIPMGESSTVSEPPRKRLKFLAADFSCKEKEMLLKDDLIANAKTLAGLNSQLLRVTSERDILSKLCHDFEKMLNHPSIIKRFHRPGISLSGLQEANVFNSVKTPVSAVNIHSSFHAPLNAQDSGEAKESRNMAASKLEDDLRREKLKRQEKEVHAETLRKERNALQKEVTDLKEKYSTCKTQLERLRAEGEPGKVVKNEDEGKKLATLQAKLIEQDKQIVELRRAKLQLNSENMKLKLDFENKVSEEKRMFKLDFLPRDKLLSSSGSTATVDHGNSIDKMQETREILTLRAQVMTLRREKQDLADQIVKSRHGLTASKEDPSGATSDNIGQYGVKKQLQSMQEVLNAKIGEISTLRAELADKTAEIEKWNLPSAYQRNSVEAREDGRSKASYNDLVTDNRHLMSDVKRLREERNDLRAQLKSKTSSKDSRSGRDGSELSDLRADLEHQKFLNDDLTKRLEIAEDRARQSESARSQYSSMPDSNINDDQLRAENTSLKATLAELEASHAKLQSKLAEHEEQAHKISGLLEAVQQHNIQLKLACNIFEESSKRHEQAATTLRRENAGLQASVEKAERFKAQMETVIGNTEKEMSYLRSENTSLRHQLSASATGNH